MERWSGVLKVPLHLHSNISNKACYYNVAASLCLSSASQSLAVPSANAIFYSGDRVSGTGNPVIERLSDLRNVAEILVTKLRGFVNAWVIEASVFNGPFAVYKDFIPSANQWGEPNSYDPTGFPASEATVALLSNCLREVKSVVFQRKDRSDLTMISGSQVFQQPKTYVFGFSKGGTVLNQLVSELSFADFMPSEYLSDPQNGEFHDQIMPRTKEAFLDSIVDIHYIDVGLNSAGAYITDEDTIKRISTCLSQRAERDKGIRFVLHGTPRQWCDSRRSWIRNEKDKLFRMIQSGAQISGGKLQVLEKFYFAERQPDLQMHFEIIEKFDVS